MKKHTILITGLLTIGIMSLIGIGCNKKVAPSSEGITYESQKARIAKLEKNIGKTRFALNGPTYQVNTTYPIPVITQFMYCGSTVSPKGNNYIRFKYIIDVDNLTKKKLRFLGNDHFEYKICMAGTLPDVGWRISIPSNNTCIFIDAQANILAIPDLLTVSINAGAPPTTLPYSVLPTSNNDYGVNGWSGYVLGSANATTKSVSKNWVMDPLSGTNPCP